MDASMRELELAAAAGDVLEVGVSAGRVILVGCAAAKLAAAAPAEELYTSDLFRKGRAFALAEIAAGRADAWAILSARHGLVLPGEVLEPYDLRLDQLDRDHRAAWGWRVASRLAVTFGARFPGAELVALAGALYVDSLPAHVRARVVEPLRGLGVGHRRAWLKKNTNPTTEAA